VIAESKKTPGAVGIRIMLTKDPGRERAPSDPSLDRIVRVAVRYNFPVNIACWEIWMPALR
jgi:hypothetical protein